MSIQTHSINFKRNELLNFQKSLPESQNLFEKVSRKQESTDQPPLLDNTVPHHSLITKMPHYLLVISRLSKMASDSRQVGVRLSIL